MGIGGGGNGNGGKSQRCVGGKFTSTGTKTQMAENLALVIRLMGEIGTDGMQHVEAKDKLFVDDTRLKLQGGNGSQMVFGWRQVEAIVRIAKYVKEVRDAR